MRTKFYKAKQIKVNCETCYFNIQNKCILKLEDIKEGKSHYCINYSLNKQLLKIEDKE